MKMDTSAAVPPHYHCSVAERTGPSRRRRRRIGSSGGGQQQQSASSSPSSSRSAATLAFLGVLLLASNPTPTKKKSISFVSAFPPLAFHSKHHCHQQHHQQEQQQQQQQRHRNQPAWRLQLQQREGDDDGGGGDGRGGGVQKRQQPSTTQQRDGGGSRKGRRKNKKPARFLQEVHFNGRQIRNRNRNPSAGTDDAFHGERNGRRAERKVGNVGSVGTGAAGPTASTATATGYRRGRSIEDLEASLSKRYGTDAGRWSASFDEYGADDFEDDDDDPNEYELDRRTLFSSTSAAKASTRTTRSSGMGGGSAARPVADPWSDEEGAGKSGGGSKMDLTHLITERPAGGRGSRSSRGGGGTGGAIRDDEYDRDDYGEDEYDDEYLDGEYDDYVEEEIDEGDYHDDNFEEEDYPPRAPASRGRRRQQQQQQGGTAPGGGGFFFRQPTAPAAAAAAAAAAQGPPAAVDRRRTPKSEGGGGGREASAVAAETTSAQKLVPLTDDDGTPLYLTVDQAERNFREKMRALATAAAEEEEQFGSEEGDDKNPFFPPTMSWEDLGISSPKLLDNLVREMDCPTPLPVQVKSCEHVLLPENRGRDVVIGTYTGSGKTLAFLVPIVDRILLEDEDGNGEEDRDGKKKKKGDYLKAVVVAPGRELASQIAAVARELLAGTGHRVGLAIGGTTYARNVEKIRKDKPSIVVGTPGRLAELFAGKPGENKSGGGRLMKFTGGIRTLVLDEFDALLQSKVHRDPTAALLETLQKRLRNNHNNEDSQLQCVMCSATASDMLLTPSSSPSAAAAKSNRLLLRYLRPDFVHVTADRDDALVTPDKGGKGQGAALSATRVSRTVIHGVIHVPHRRFALETLRRILHTDPLPQQILVFVDNSRKVKIIVDKLAKMGIVAAPLHGGAGSDKSDRAEVSKALREGYVGLVVATEMAARGLDAPLLTHVVNYDLPTDASHYAHRAGRCGRGGRPGVVINLTTGPRERHVPNKFARELGIDMYEVEPKSGKLNLVANAAGGQQ